MTAANVKIKIAENFFPALFGVAKLIVKKHKKHTTQDATLLNLFNFYRL